MQTRIRAKSSNDLWRLQLDLSRAGAGDDSARLVASGKRPALLQELIVDRDNLIHVFLRSKRQEQVACCVCRKGANLGMVLAPRPV